MSDRTAIEWTDSTFNPWIGCTKVGPGCDHCYAEADMDKRRHRVRWGAGNPRSLTSAAYWKQPRRWNAEPFVQCTACGWRGEHREALRGIAKASNGICPNCSALDTMAPARRRVFCASLADVFDNEVPAEWHVGLFALIAATPNLDWLLLTKRIGNVEKMLGDYRTLPLLPNIWLGATIVNRTELLRDAPKLKATLARVHFWSVEPMLGDLGRIPSELMPDWVVVGGESGPGARPMHPAWARSLRDQCAAAGVPFLFKQWGAWAPGSVFADRIPSGEYCDFDDELKTDNERVWHVGKKASGRRLDGVLHNDFPEARAP